MKLRRIGGMTGAALATFSLSGHAQLHASRVVSSVDLSATAVTYADSVRTRGGSITPTFRVDWSRATIGGSATLSQLSGGGSSIQLSLAPSVFTPSAGMFVGEFAGAFGGSTHDDGSRTGQALGIGRVYAIGDGRGAWAGGGAGRTWDGFAWSAMRQAEIGGWLSRANITTLATVTPVVVQDTIRYADVQGALRYPTGNFELGLTAGVRAGAAGPVVGGSSRAWGSASVIGWLTQQLALVGSVGTYPVDLTQGFPGGRFISVALRVASANTRQVERETDAAERGSAASGSGAVSFELGPATRGSTRRELRVFAPGARSVEITGDFTQWIPVALTRQGDGWWSVSHALATGAYQMNMRIDRGAWFPPPGLLTARDEFGGTAGILTIE